MNEGSMKDSIKLGIDLLKEVDLLNKINNTRPLSLNSNKFSDKFYSVCQKDIYKDIYTAIMDNSDYDILLHDYSVIQFSMNINRDKVDDMTIRYAYYPNFGNVKTYKEFLEELDLDYDECGEEFMYEYEQSLAEAEINIGICPIRYDYDYRLYQGINHSVSHIHIGHKYEVRIATSKVLTFDKFILFVIRNIYPLKWKTITSSRKLLEECLKIKSKCKDIKDEHFTREEKKLFYLD